MPSHGGGFEQSYNGQATVDTESMLIVEHHISQQTNEKKEITPAIENLSRLPDDLGKVDTLLADTGYFSQANVECNAKPTVSSPTSPSSGNSTTYRCKSGSLSPSP